MPFLTGHYGPRYEQYIRNLGLLPLSATVLDLSQFFQAEVTPQSRALGHVAYRRFEGPARAENQVMISLLVAQGV